MSLATAGVAATTAAAAYLDAKFHLRKDLRDWIDTKRTGSKVASLMKQDRLNCFYEFETKALALENERCLWYRGNPSAPPVEYTWKQTYDNSLRWAQFLLEHSVEPGDLVGTYLVNSPDCAFNMVGSWAIGAAPALINYNLAGDALVHCLKTAESKILIVDDDEGCRERIEQTRAKIEALGIRVIILDGPTRASIFARESKRPKDELRKGATPGSPLFLFYTSGTTGFPKACAFPVAACYGLATRERKTGLKAGQDGDTWYNCMPLYHGTGCTSMTGCLTMGIQFAIGRKFSVRSFWHDIHDSRAHCFTYVGETARYLLAAPPSPLDQKHHLKSMYGNGMRPDVWRQFMDRFNVPRVVEFFNSTEGMFMLNNTCTGPFHDAHVGHHGVIQRWQLHNKYVPIEINHEDPDNVWRDPTTGFARRKSYNEGGEILVACGTEKDFVGYWNNPSATSKRFARDVLRKGDLYYRTGDALRRDNDGRWYFLDRLGDTFRWKAENVSTADVADALGRHPAILEANVYGVALPNHDGKAGCAAVFLGDNTDIAKFDFEDLLAYSRKVLPKYAVPVFLRVMEKQTPMHNNKQSKVPYVRDGVDPEKVRTGDAGQKDQLFWIPPGAATYEPFGKKEWDSIVNGKARL